MGDRERIAEYYDNLARLHGYSHLTADANTRKSVEIRYKALMEVGNWLRLGLLGKRVLDVGCGCGALYCYLPGVLYTGIDISGEAIRTAKAKNPWIDAYCADVLCWDEPADVVLAQGIFYLMKENPEAKMQAMIEKMFSLAREAVAFTTLSAWADRKNEGEFYADPLRTLEFCRTLTPKVVLRHDYHPGDFAIYLYK